MESYWNGQWHWCYGWHNKKERLCDVGIVVLAHKESGIGIVVAIGRV